MTLLGTALRPAATRVMLLGSGELGKEVAIECQRLGVKSLPWIVTLTRQPCTLPIAPTYQHAGWRGITPARRA
jgi:phosphoribosylaminoimidazole carboxylase (NCAIR synthetase)